MYDETQSGARGAIVRADGAERLCCYASVGGHYARCGTRWQELIVHFNVVQADARGPASPLN
jgi:hypothetical protein